VTDAAPSQFDAFVTPGSLLKAAREDYGISEREAADRLNLMPGYVAILERDDYQALRSPPFARGYVKAYGRLLGIDEKQLLAAFDRLQEQQSPESRKKVETRPLQLQHTGLGVVIGLAVLGLLVVVLWWWQGSGGQPRKQPLPASAEVQEERLPGAIPAGES
jgi:cytoskeletal protein RodZ